MITSIKTPLTDKERTNLNAWHRWGKQMEFLKAIDRELAPKRAELDRARKFIGIN